MTIFFLVWFRPTRAGAEKHSFPLFLFLSGIGRLIAAITVLGGKVNRLFLPFLAKAWRFREERFLFCFVHVLRCRCRCGRWLCPVGLLSPGILISGLQQLRSDDGSETIITIIVFSVLE